MIKKNYVFITMHEGRKEYVSPDGNTRTKDEMDLVAARILHTVNLFDQDESTSGSKIDETTGEPYDNSTATAIDGLVVVEDDHVQEDLTEGEKWLRTQESDVGQSAQDAYVSPQKKKAKKGLPNLL